MKLEWTETTTGFEAVDGDGTVWECRRMAGGDWQLLAFHSHHGFESLGCYATLAEAMADANEEDK